MRNKPEETAENAITGGPGSARDENMAGEERPRRLCSEIQLFDLCDKTRCASRDGRFCTDENLLNRFEAISQEEVFPADEYLVYEMDGEDEEGGAYPGYENDFGDEENEPEEDY